MAATRIPCSSRGRPPRRVNPALSMSVRANSPVLSSLSVCERVAVENGNCRWPLVVLIQMTSVKSAMLSGPARQHPLSGAPPIGAWISSLTVRESTLTMRRRDCWRQLRDGQPGLPRGAVWLAGAAIAGVGLDVLERLRANGVVRLPACIPLVDPHVSRSRRHRWRSQLVDLQPKYRYCVLRGRCCDVRWRHRPPTYSGYLDKSTKYRELCQATF